MSNPYEFDKSIISTFRANIDTYCPTLRGDLEKCKTNEEAYFFLKAAASDLDEELEKKASSKKSQELVRELHRYNKYKDVAQMMIGTLAELQGTTSKEFHEKWNLPMD